MAKYTHNMTRLVDLEHKLYSADPTIRVYTTRFILNAAALRLLGIPEMPLYDADTGNGGRKWLSTPRTNAN